MNSENGYYMAFDFCSDYAEFELPEGYTNADWAKVENQLQEMEKMLSIKIPREYEASNDEYNRTIKFKFKFTEALDYTPEIEDAFDALTDRWTT